MAPDGLWPSSQNFIIAPYPGPVQSSSHQVSLKQILITVVSIQNVVFISCFADTSCMWV